MKKSLFFIYLAFGFSIVQSFEEAKKINSSAQELIEKLFKAASTNNISDAEALIGQGVNVNALDSQGNTPLHIAVFHNEPALTSLLLQHGALVNAQNSLGNTPLQYAIHHGFTPIVQTLLNAGASVYIKNNGGVTPFDSARYFKDRSPDIFKLVEQARSKETQGFLSAIAHSDLSEVKRIIQQGININAIVDGEAGNTALHMATFNPHNSEIITTLIKAGANINAQNREGNTPLVFAIMHGFIDNVKALLKAGASVTIQNKGGTTPLQVAQYYAQNHPQPGSNAWAEILALLKKAAHLAQVHPAPPEVPPSELKALSAEAESQISQLVSQIGALKQQASANQALASQNQQDLNKLKAALYAYISNTRDLQDAYQSYAKMFTTPVEYEKSKINAAIGQLQAKWDSYQQAVADFNSVLSSLGFGDEQIQINEHYANIIKGALAGTGS